MSTIAVITSNLELFSKINEFCDEFDGHFNTVFQNSIEKGREYLNYELPEITVFDFSDTKLDVAPVFESVKKDPWLHYGGIIIVHNSSNEKELLEKVADSNIISLIHTKYLNSNFPRVLRILKQNRQILFQRELQQSLIANISGSFLIDNDPFDVITYANIVSNYLFNSNYIEAEKRDSINVALIELLMNAIEHGNCQISYNKKSEILNSGEDIFEFIREQNKIPEIKNKKVHFTYRISQNKSTFLIKDEGDGFDWKNIKNPTDTANQYEAHGRGIMMAKIYVSDLTYNDVGNEVSFIVNHQHNTTNIVPSVFDDQQETIFEDGEVVFTEGETSDFLYYIVKGELEISTAGNVVSKLSPDDIFLGEMSFLLNNQRSATVKSIGESILIKISKEAFVSTIKKNPHYGIFLARLLAQRLSRLNNRLS